jgi:autotransporter-associated beta strand protein
MLIGANRTVRSLFFGKDLYGSSGATLDVYNTDNSGAARTLTLQAASGNATITMESGFQAAQIRLGMNSGGNTILNSSLDLYANDATKPFFFDGVVTGTNAINKYGAGRSTATRGNTFSGGLNIFQGEFVTWNNGLSAGSGTVTVGGSGSADAATWGVGSSVTRTNTVVVNAGTGARTISLTSLGAGLPVLSGGMTLNKDVTFDIAQIAVGTHDKITLSGAVSGTGGIVKTGTGVLELSGVNTYSGRTVIEGGTLSLKANQTVGDESELILAANAVLVLEFDSTETVRKLSLNSGTSWLAPGTYTAAQLSALGSGTYSGSGTLTVPLYPQTISFGNLPSKVYGDVPFNPGAVASSGLPVRYAVSDFTKADFLGITGTTNLLRILAAGTVTVTAFQDGDASYLAAAPVSQNLTVSRKALTVRARNMSRPFGEKNPPLKADYTGFVNGDNAVAVTLACAATNNSPEGMDVITATGPATNSKYSISYESGTLAVRPVLRGLTLLSAAGAWTGSGIVAVSGNGAQTNQVLNGAFETWNGMPVYKSDGPSRQIIMRPVINSSVLPLLTAGYTYEYGLKGFAGSSAEQTNMTAEIIVRLNGTNYFPSSVTGVNCAGGTGPGYPGRISGVYEVDQANAYLGGEVWLRIKSEGSRSRFAADADTGLSVRLTRHAGYNDGFVYSTSFDYGANGLIADDRILGMAFAGTGGTFVENGDNGRWLNSQSTEKNQFLISCQTDSFRKSTVYTLSFEARKWVDGDPQESRLAVSIGSYTTNVVISTNKTLYSITADAMDAGVCGEAVSVGLTPAALTGAINQYRIYNLTLHAKARFESWYQDNNRAGAGFVLDFTNRWNTAELPTWADSRSCMDGYTIREDQMFAMSESLRQKIGDVLNSNGIPVCIDSTSIVWAHLSTNNPVFSSTRFWLNRLSTLNGWKITSVDMQSVMSKPAPDGQTYTYDQREEDIVSFMRVMRPFYPDLKIGLVDACCAHDKPYKTIYTNLKNRLAEESFALDYLQMDFPIDFIWTGGGHDFTLADLLEQARWLEEELGCPAGIYLTSPSGGKTSDQAWRDDVMNGLDDFLGAGGGLRRVTLSAWYPYPEYSAPDNPDIQNNANGATQLGTFLLMDELLKEYGGE